MKKMLLILLLIGWVCGEEWNATKDNIESSETTNDITETFNFPYDLNDINVQSMVVEVEANGVCPM
jgi:hypothetical protein